MKNWQTALVGLLASILCARTSGAAVEISGELKQWHDVVLTFEGPQASEAGVPNPFRDYRLNVTFTQGEKRVLAPGHFAADGKAAETGAESGNKWRVHFVPDATGEWTYQASFRTGPDIAVSLDPQAGQPAAYDGESGKFTVGPSDKSKPDLRARGLLRYAGQHYLQFAGTGEYFIKGGADSPENFLAYIEFDQTPANAAVQPTAKEGEARRAPKHRFEPHARAGGPATQPGRAAKARISLAR